MESNGPITSAVYGRRAAARKPRKPARERKPVTTLVGQQLGEETVAGIYSALGFKRPEQRRRRRGGRRG